MVILWMLTTPAVYFFVIQSKGCVEATWSCIDLAYVAMNLCELVLLATFDWRRCSEKAQQREALLLRRHREESDWRRRIQAADGQLESMPDETTPVLTLT